METVVFLYTLLCFPRSHKHTVPHGPVLAQPRCSRRTSHKKYTAVCYTAVYWLKFLFCFEKSNLANTDNAVNRRHFIHHRLCDIVADIRYGIRYVFA